MRRRHSISIPQAKNRSRCRDPGSFLFSLLALRSHSTWVGQVLRLKTIKVRRSCFFIRRNTGWQGAKSPDGCAVWSCADISIDKWHKTALFTTSAVTTLLFVPGSVWAVWGGSRALRRPSAWIATLAFVVNAHWYVLYGGSARQDLRIGYFLWWLSFLLLALGPFDLSRPEAGKR